MLEWKKQAGQMGKMQMTLCNTANSILGTLNRNTQQSDDGERKPQKRNILQYFVTTFTLTNMILFLDWLQGDCFGLDVTIFLKKSPWPLQQW